jgi:hypothetical protein
VGALQKNAMSSSHCNGYCNGSLCDSVMVAILLDLENVSSSICFFPLFTDRHLTTTWKNHSFLQVLVEKIKYEIAPELVERGKQQIIMLVEETGD